nr:uncharacterized protein LOC127315443 [Lolium perenne]
MAAIPPLAIGRLRPRPWLPLPCSAASPWTPLAMHGPPPLPGRPSPRADRRLSLDPRRRLDGWEQDLLDAADRPLPSSSSNGRRSSPVRRRQKLHWNGMDPVRRLTPPRRLQAPPPRAATPDPGPSSSPGASHSSGQPP